MKKFVLVSLLFAFWSPIVSAETAVTPEWNCFDHVNSNEAVLPDKVDLNNLEEWQVLTSSVDKPNYALDDFQITEVKPANMAIPGVGQKRYFLMSYRYKVADVQHWGVYFCNKTKH